MLSLQSTDGCWWFALEANESIGAEFIFLMNYLGAVDEGIQKGIARRILDVQRPDGTWAIYNDGPPCLSTTVECYFALKIAGYDTGHEAMVRAREFILAHGGIEKTRVFTKIHLAMFGIVPWEAAAAMPAEFILLPIWIPFGIYEFSSWARATIVPLLIFMSLRKTCKLPDRCNIDELFVNPPDKRDYSFRTNKGFFSWEHTFIIIDRCLKFFERIPFKPLRKIAINQCLKWTWEHVEKTEDIYPALAYGALAFKAAGYSVDSPQIAKPFRALKMFQQVYTTTDVPALPSARSNDLAILRSPDLARIHQQCCISPVWDTPWMLTALLEAGVAPNNPALLLAGRWLISKQITDVRGDWAVKNPKARPGGWSFEFENAYFPDVDDTIQVLNVLNRLDLPWREKEGPMRLGIDWLLSMQNDDGGWGAFDKNQKQLLVNRIPFSDHGACLDPSSPDIAGRMLEFLAARHYSAEHEAVARAMSYIWKTQEPFGGWFARWGINYIYGTWCVLTGLGAMGHDMNDPRVVKAVQWLKSIQHADGGFGESPESYVRQKFADWPGGVPSQTAWALMGLVAGEGTPSESAERAARFLLENRNENGSWNEKDHTGTGFPGHFYIRYHGYRHFFPLLALARYFNLKKVVTGQAP